MKLYATVTSERATKGQGGNDFLEIIVTLNDKFNKYLSLFIQQDGSIELSNSSGVMIYRNNAVEFTEAKGNKQKDETCEHGYGKLNNGIGACPSCTRGK